MGEAVPTGGGGLKMGDVNAIPSWPTPAMRRSQGEWDDKPFNSVAGVRSLVRSAHALCSSRVIRVGAHVMYHESVTEPG